MFDLNPYPVQEPASVKGADATPLFLIHDGSGTTFSYHLIEDLDRPVYGIYNPHFWTGNGFKGGIPEMARYYADFIREALWHSEPPERRQKVLVGGWSLGGMIAVEMIRLLEDDPDICLAGVVLIDSPYPYESTNAYSSIKEGLMEGRSSPDGQITKLVMEQFTHATSAVTNWKPAKRASKRSSFSDSTDSETDDRHKPRTILLRARDFVPTESRTQSTKWGVCSLDAYRTYRSLGWSRCPGLIDTVLDIPGHHFTVFDPENISQLSSQLAKACDTMDRRR